MASLNYLFDLLHNRLWRVNDLGRNVATQRRRLNGLMDPHDAIDNLMRTFYTAKENLRERGINLKDIPIRDYGNTIPQENRDDIARRLEHFIGLFEEFEEVCNELRRINHQRLIMMRRNLHFVRRFG